jgi:hypothetical protein
MNKPHNARSPPELSRTKRRVFSLVGCAVLPLLAMAVEVGLRLAGYGYPTGFFKPLLGDALCLG